MLKKAFYILKPLIPRSFQLFLRRKLILFTIKKYNNIWPILSGSEKKPSYWENWPDNKKFALILTHDVEHQRGYDRILDLVNIEKELGYVSSFNLIPERDYTVESSLLKILVENGFEYGIHGLKHDGKLFSSKKEFMIRAKRINYYLNEWGAVGFRAPAMQHNLDWIGALDIEYDLSTFDTDPFEPQPDGAGTIFPFWVESKLHKNGGYIEMPYTLPQDFTPFVLLREKTIKIWQKKTDWVAENGGMVLVNVHPDYISINSTRKHNEEFDLEIYLKFLRYIREKYGYDFWNPLPKQAAQYCEKFLRKRNFCIKKEFNS